MAPKDHVLVPAEMTPKDHVMESSEMVPKEAVAKSVGEARPPGGAACSGAASRHGAREQVGEGGKSFLNESFQAEMC